MVVHSAAKFCVMAPSIYQNVLGPEQSDLLPLISDLLSRIQTGAEFIAAKISGREVKGGGEDVMAMFERVTDSFMKVRVAITERKITEEVYRRV